jgi:hypothetical protein
MPELTRIKVSSLFASHDIVNILVFVFLLGLPYFSADILVLEFWCIPSIALMAHQLGGLETQRWAYHGYLFLLATPLILMIIPRFYHKRLINNMQINVAGERRKAMCVIRRPVYKHSSTCR